MQIRQLGGITDDPVVIAFQHRISQVAFSVVHLCKPRQRIRAYGGDIQGIIPLRITARFTDGQ